MMTDDELPDDGSKRGIAFMRFIGATAGAEFAQNYGRRPTKAEFAAYMAEKVHLTPDVIERGTLKEVRMNRRVAYEFRQGFEQGCKAALEGQREANSPAF